MNIAEILKDCPKGTKLYSPIFGDVFFHGANDSEEYPILVKSTNGYYSTFTSEGKLYKEHNGECMLFPSKENRDWTTFKTLVKEAPVIEYNFKPFDRVLVRDDDSPWRIELFERMEEGIYKYQCMGSSYAYCIPYEGNEHLLGTDICLLYSL